MYLILFDIDGTLLHIRKGLSQEIFAKVLKETFDITLDKKIHIDFAGRTDFGIISSIFKSINADVNLFINNKDLIYSKINEEFKQQLQPSDINIMDGVKELLAVLHNDENFTLGLVTGNFRLNAFTKLEMAGLMQFFNFGAFGDDFPNRLDLPKIALQEAKKKYPEITNRKTIVIGDTHRDIQSAKHNKMHSLAIATGNTPYYELLKFEPDLIYSSLEDYLQVYNDIKKLFKLNG